MKNDKGELGRKLGQGMCTLRNHAHSHMGLLTTKDRFAFSESHPFPSQTPLAYIGADHRSRAFCWDSLTEITMLGKPHCSIRPPSVQSSNEHSNGGRIESQEERSQPANSPLPAGRLLPCNVSTFQMIQMQACLQKRPTCCLNFLSSLLLHVPCKWPSAPEEKGQPGLHFRSATEGVSLSLHRQEREVCQEFYART